MSYKIICKGSQRWTEDYTTIDELKDALEYHGLPLTLATFESFDSYGMSINRYRHYEVIMDKTSCIKKYEDKYCSYEIMEHIGTLKRDKDNWDMEVNFVAWNGSYLPAKIDIRTWSEDHEQMTRGITLTEDEAWRLAELLVYRKGYQIVDDDLNVI